MPWTDELWPFVIQLYQKKPSGIKPMYSRDTVRLALELHIPPQVIYQKMFRLRQPLPPSLERLMETVGKSPKKLSTMCRKLRSLNGMGNAGEFYDNVKVCETFELDFRPVNAPTAQMTGRPLMTPVMLIMILDLYFRLIPATMVEETPDVRDMARMLDIRPEDIVYVLEIFLRCDPFVETPGDIDDPMLEPCKKIWCRYAYDDPMILSNLARQLEYYWK
ncbi:MAG: hypothetical protein NC344_01990 [Bacteroidales bacterium]|nr:hypothetical protein [Bacteroidales bacterium]MCM1146603.1 hypothetical protein [Bacteroidales bacterium]MCM1205995.1 hypothetical protein [Bacillota bacterium]MCM1510123.1 hypothetical protein [Clostridium sp.]